MEEIFEIVKAVNRLGDKIKDVSGKVDIVLDTLSQSPTRELANHYVNEETASAILKRCPRSLQRLRRSGELSFTRAGKKALYKIDDLKEFLEKTACKPSD